MSKFKEKLRALENYKALQEHLPSDHSKRQSLTSYVESVLRPAGEPTNVLDLGCGEASSVDLFKSIAPSANWHGVDIETSPEVSKRTREHHAIKIFDGVNLPYPDNYFDFIYCNQVLEHVRHPDKLMAEVCRVLKPGGTFAGAVSYLEPFHSYSIFNFTPYGVVRVLEDNGLKLDELRPGADASLLINRQLMNRAALLRPFWNRNYLHLVCSLMGSVFSLTHAERNFLKLQFSGHLVFLARATPQASRANTPTLHATLDN